KHGVEIPMDRISNINFHQTMWERVIGAGDLEIESAGRDGQSKFNDVWHPDAVQQELYRVMEEHARTRAGWNAGTGAGASAPPPPAASGSLSVAEQIQQLAGLRDSGAITAAEYEAKKAQLLERM
ncbi:MAG TPA: SHOCT domain-containing protein, partial [Acidimicrobiales bacterium]|nr:SHOCT domain-containing protein [Acidimicrobiales bacterium]